MTPFAELLAKENAVIAKVNGLSQKHNLNTFERQRLKLLRHEARTIKKAMNRHPFFHPQIFQVSVRWPV